MRIEERYELTRQVQEGPEGALWLGVDHGADDEAQQVVVKLVAPARRGELWLEHQQRHVQLYHSALVPVLSAGLLADGQGYLIRPRLGGAPLHRWYAESSAAQREVTALVGLILRVCDGLEVSHRVGVAHLGLKPGNVLVREAGQGLSAQVMDFGLAPREDAGLYLAPEQAAEGGAASLRADVYGVGMLLLALLRAGEPDARALEKEVPLSRRRSMSGGWAALMDRRVEELPVWLIDPVRRALSEDPQERHPSLEELARELRQGLYASAGRAGNQREEAGRARVDIREGLIEGLERAQGPKGEVLKFRLRHRDGQGEWVRTGAFFYTPDQDDPSGHFMSLGGAWRGAELSLFGAHQVGKAGETFYTAGNETLPVLEPYFPVTVSDVIKSQGCAARYLVDLRDNGDTGVALVVGRVMHQMLELLTQPEGAALVEDFDALVAEAIPRHRLELLAAGVDQKGLAKVLVDLRRHYDRLLELARGRGLLPLAGASGEVTRFSGAYGLEGRTDLVVDDGERFRVLDLKTGSAREGDALQVRCYMLLWDRVAAAANRRLEGELLYSKSGDYELVEREDHERERQLVRARNAVVSLHRHLAFGDAGAAPPWFGQYQRQCEDQACQWRRGRCRQQGELIGEGPNGALARVTGHRGAWAGVEPALIELARDYYHHFVRLIESERWSSTRQLGEVLRQDTLPERIERHRAAAGLTLVSADARRGRIVLSGNGLEVFSPDREVMLHRGDFERGQPVRASVVSAAPGALELRSGAAAALEGAPAEGWIVDVVPARVGFREMHRALLELLRERDLWRLRMLLLRQAPPPTVTPAWLSSLDHLNEQQRRAVTEAVLCRGAHLIQGPPGTGKTTVIAEIVRQVVERGERVLLAAATNTAVDNILARLVETGFSDFLRLGSAEDSELAQILRGQGLKVEERFSHQLALGIEDLDALKARLARVQVFAGTTHRAASHPIIEALERAQGHQRRQSQELPRLFDLVILDEASQITEPMALAVLHRARRFVLVGDHQQLPPVITAERALTAWLEANPDSGPHGERAARLRERAGVGGLDRSLFERLVEHLPCTRLEEQYRMNAALMEFSSRQFYQRRMKTAQVVADLHLPVDPEALAALPAPLAEALDPARPIALCDVRGQERHHRNPDEAALILRLLEALLEGELLTWRRGAPAFDPQEAPRQIGIISPFRAQVQLLREQVAARFPRHAAQVEIDTVERFQGREKEIIMVSFVTAGRTSAFLANHRRLNVTLTRARSKLILIGDLNTLQDTSPLLRDMIASATSPPAAPTAAAQAYESNVFHQRRGGAGAEVAAQ